VRSKIDIRYSILLKLLLITLVPAATLISALGIYFYMQARATLEDEMSRRLVGIARSAAYQIDPELVIRFMPGDDQGRPYQALAAHLGALAKNNDVDRIYVTRLDYTILFDTDADSRIGQKMYRLAGDRRELKQIAARHAISSTLFQSEGGRWYKAGYAPLVVGDQVVGLVGVDAGVRFFDRLREVRRNILIIGFSGILILAAVSLLFARRLVRPIRRLSKSASLIGEGQYQVPIEAETRDEIGFLAETLNHMRLRIIERDRYLQMIQRGIAHEVRNPLGGMELYCDILQEELAERPDLKKHVDKIRRELRGLEAVVNEFLDFTRETVPDIRPVILGEFISELLLPYAGMCETQKICIEKKVDLKIDKALFDPDLTRRLLHNLILNAIQAMPQGGRLDLTIFKDETDLIFEISDTGVGIPDAVKESIFTPFVTTKDKGTGLGLPFAQKIVESHGGTIQVLSHEGSGTTVRFNYPQPPWEEK